MLAEFIRECLAVDVSRRLTSDNVPERLSAQFLLRGTPKYIRSDNGPEFTARTCSALAGSCRRADFVYRTSESVRERIHRILQR